MFGHLKSQQCTFVRYMHNITQLIYVLCEHGWCMHTCNVHVYVGGLCVHIDFYSAHFILVAFDVVVLVSFARPFSSRFL